MSKQRVLYVCQEITPYLPETPMAKTCRQLPQGIQESGKEIRTFMPKYGSVNERRNQLHEVIRLSGMNLIINDADHPLIIKVASIQAARMQVYFIDNEDYFSRKNIVKGDDGKYFEDNDERAIFFARGVIETINKLNWSPDIIHCHGWFTSLVPVYIKKAFNDNPIFANTKVISSVYDNCFDNILDKKFPEKILMEGISNEDLASLNKNTCEELMKLAVDFSDGVTVNSPEVNENVVKYANEKGLPVLEYKDENEFINANNEFYDKIMEG